MSFYLTLGNCVDLIKGTCTHLKNVLTCKNSNVANICRDTCNNCGPKPGTYISISENLKKVYQKGNTYQISYSKYVFHLVLSELVAIYK